MMKFTYNAVLVMILLHPALGSAASEAAKNSAVAKAIKSMSELIINKKLSNFEVIPEEALFRVKGNSFTDYSKCLNEPVADQLEHFGKLIVIALKSDESITLKIAGHANVPSSNSQAAKSERDCINDNDEYGLSYMRASAVRKALDISSSFDIDTVGYGADELLNEQSPSDLENSRVDIRFIVEPEY